MHVRNGSVVAAMFTVLLVLSGCSAMFVGAPSRTSTEWLGWYHNQTQNMLITVGDEKADLSASDERRTSYVATASLQFDGMVKGTFAHEEICVSFTMPATDDNTPIYRRIMIGRRTHGITPELPVGHLTIVECASPSGAIVVDLYAAPHSQGVLVGSLP